MNTYQEAMTFLDSQVGNKDALISLSTISLTPNADGTPKPAARIIDAYYEDGAFYSVTSGPSSKMKEIEANPSVAICVIVENFTANGIGENLGWVGEEKNAAILAKLHQIFAAWYNEANDDTNVNTCILKIQLTDGFWNNPHEGTWTKINFTNQTVEHS